MNFLNTQSLSTAVEIIDGIAIGNRQRRSQCPIPTWHTDSYVLLLRLHQAVLTHPDTVLHHTKLLVVTSHCCTETNTRDLVKQGP